MMGGMDDMNTPMPPMDAGQDMMPPEGGDQDPMGGEEPPMDDAGAPQDDMGGGEDDELMNLINSLSIEDKAAVKKYAESMADEGDGEEPPMDDAGAPQDDMGGEMPMESRFNFKHIIDEIFNDDSKSVFAGTDRPQKEVGEDGLTDYNSPFLPR